MSRIRYWGPGCIIVAALMLTCKSGASAPTVQEAAIRDLVAGEATAELASWRVPVAELAAEGVTLRRIDTAGTVQLWEARPAMDHWHRYVVAVDGTRMWRLAGFQADDLPDFYNATQASSGDARDPDQVGRYLVALMDPSGTDLLYPGRGGERAVVRAWNEARPPVWPGDTTAGFPGGSRVLRLTTLSRQVNSYDQSWVPSVYTFYFDSSGYLRAWFRREGPLLRPRP